MEKIIETVSVVTGLKVEEILSERRMFYTAEARFMICAFARQLLPRKYTLEVIGEAINRNYSTVIHAIKRHDLLYKTNKYYRRCYDELTQMYDDWENGYISMIEEREIMTPYGKRKAMITIRYNKLE